jgi:hypothetical protein
MAWALASIDGSNQLSSVSCGGALCAAVDTAGNVVTSITPTGGPGAWKIVAFDIGNVPSAISCPRATYCVAVDASGNVVESTNPTGGPTAWQPTKADQNPLFVVSCPSLSFCLAADSISSATVGAPGVPPVSLTVNFIGASVAGIVTGTGIDCPVDACTNSYEPGTVVSLTATSNPGFAFTGWSGAGCSGTGTCDVTLGSNHTVTAAFTPTRVLTVSVAGTGSGTVTSSSGGIDCTSGACTATYNQGTVVTLTATAASGSAFIGWSGGGCSGTAACVLTMNSDQPVTATFAPAHVLSVSLAGTGTGSVIASGIGCPGVCSGSYPQGTVLALSAVPAPGSGFAGWTGACSGTGPCLVTMNTDQGVTAAFTPAQAGSPSKPACMVVRKSGKVHLTVPKRRNAGSSLASASLTFRCDQAVGLRLAGVVTVLPRTAHPGAHGKTLPMRVVRRSARAGAPVVFIVRLPKAALTALGAGRHELATFRLTATNANGTTATTARVRLRR